MTLTATYLLLTKGQFVRRTIPSDEKDFEILEIELRAFLRLTILYSIRSSKVSVL